VLKGIGVSTIMKMTIGLLVASLFISASTVGEFGQAIRSGMGDITEVTDFTTEVENEYVLSDLAMFVQHRAVNEGCELVEDINSGMDSSNLEGYPYSDTLNGYAYLEGTRLTRTPECFGTEASVIRDQFNWLPGRGTFDGGPDEDYMPGVYSREQFRITADITLDTSTDDTWLENRLGRATHEKTLNQLGEIQRDDPDGGISALEGAMMVTAPATYATIELYSRWRNAGKTDVEAYTVVFETDGIDQDRRMDEDGDVVKVQLCPGDEGYVQANREYIDNEDYTSAEPLYPVIVVTELGEDCGKVNIDRTDKIPDNTKTSGRLLHITGDTSKNHPYVRGPGLGGGRRNYAFDFHDLNEEDDTVEQGVYSAALNGIEFYHNSDKADKCIIGMWDHRSSGVDSTGWITFDQGTHIYYFGTFPDRDSDDVDQDRLGDRTDRRVPPYPSARNLYDQYANEGFVSESWNRDDVNNKILYDFGSRQFELYGDLLCGEHDENNDFDDHHSQWYMCDGDISQVRADGETWTCHDSGRWTRY